MFAAAAATVSAGESCAPRTPVRSGRDRRRRPSPSPPAARRTLCTCCTIHAPRASPPRPPPARSSSCSAPNQNLAAGDCDGGGAELADETSAVVFDVVVRKKVWSRGCFAAWAPP